MIFVSLSSEADHNTQLRDVPYLASIKDRWKPKGKFQSKGILNVADTGVVKQSSFESTDSSVIIPMGEEPDRRSSSNSSSKFFNFRKTPLQVFSKEYANAPVMPLIN